MALTTILASVITAIITAALLIIVIFVLAVCKCHPKFTPRRAESAASAGGEEGQAQAVQLDRDVGDGVLSDPTYVEIRENMMELNAIF